jgi:hypothetical protein
MLEKVDFDYLYENMTLGQKQHMANRLFKRDNIWPQQIDWEPPYSIGDKFKSEGPTFKGTYILAQSEYDKVALVNVDTGRAWCDPIHVENPYSITNDELKETFGSTGKFRRIL